MLDGGSIGYLGSATSTDRQGGAAVPSTRKLIVTENITLDGVIDNREGWIDVVGDEEVDQSDLNEALREQAEAADAVLFGRVTFEEMRGYWPLQTDDETGVTEYLNNVSKYVVSNTMKDPEWQRSTVLSGDPEGNVRELKGKAGKDIVVTGSITLVHDLIAAGLVDEYRLFVTRWCSGVAGDCSRTQPTCPS
jgi:dihydrofolate reductase